MSELIVYGDFNCPFSRLASARIVELERRGTESVDFRAVEHDPTIPAEGVPVRGDVEEGLNGELATIRGMLGPEERDPLRLPSRRLNTARAVAAYAAAPGEQRAGLRERIFSAYWEEDRDISDPTVLAELGAPEENPELAAVWHEEWSALPEIVPVMVLPDGYVSRGLGALRRLGDLAGIA